MILSVSVMSLCMGLNEASLETTAAANEDMAKMEYTKARVVQVVDEDEDG